MKAAISALLLAWSAAHGTLAPVAPEDFAFGRPLSLDGAAAIYRLPLPPEVYRHAVHGDLADLRVFNAAGEPVPHSLRRPSPDAAPREDPVELAFFPLPGHADDPMRPLSVAVTRDADGAVVRIEHNPAFAQASRPGGYLIDTSQLDRPPAALELEWTDARSNFVARISIAGSDDLASWRPLVERASVARLHFAGRLLERRRIEIPRNTASYLRLDWPDETGAATLSAVTAWFRAPLAEIRRGWVELDGVPAKGDRPAFDYELAGHVAVDRVGLALPPGNALVAATISSRHERGDWRPRYRGSFYRVAIDGAVLAREDAAIGTTRASHWRVAPEDGTVTTAAAPRLRLGWVLDDLYFLNRGDAPFTLAYGAAAAPTEAIGVEELLARIDARDEEGFIGRARAGDAFALGGEARLQPAARALPWRQLVLWGILVLGVFGLGVMAWRLWRQMKQDQAAG